MCRPVPTMLTSRYATASRLQACPHNALYYPSLFTVARNSGNINCGRVGCYDCMVIYMYMY